MADIASQYPTSPSFNQVTISTNTPTLATETFSGKTRRIGQGHTFYNWQIKYPTLTDREAGLVEGFLAQTYGSLFSFEIVLPEVSYSKSNNPPSTTPATTTSYAAGAKSVALDNCGANKEVLYSGDYFKFDNHSKVYQAVATCTSDGSGVATLFFAGSLVTSVPNDTDLTLTAVPFTAISENDVQKFDVGIGGLTSITVDMRETWQMKSFAGEEYLKDEYYRDHTIACDLIEIHLKDSNDNDAPLYLASGGINIDFDSDTAPTAGTNTYSAQGEFLGHSAINEDFDVKVGKFSINLSGLPSGYVDRFVGKEPEGKRVVVYKCFLDLNTLQIIGTDSAGGVAAINMFDGEVYNVSIQETANSCSISIEASSHFADFERQAGRRTNDWSNWLFQGAQYDSAFEKAGFVGNQEFLWGRTE